MKVLQLVLVLFLLAIVAAVPFAFGGLLSQTSASSASPSTLGIPVPLANGIQLISIHASPEGYSPASFTVKKGVPVRILFSADQYAGCGRQLIMRDFGVNVVAQAGQQVPIEFTPTAEGVFPYRCSMNMFRGQMTVTA